MPEASLDIVLKVIDNASAEFKKVNAEAIKQVDDLKNSTNKLTDSTKKMGTESKKSTDAFKKGIKEVHSGIREFHNILGLALFSIASITVTTSEWSQRNSQTKQSLDKIALTIKDITGLIGSLFAPVIISLGSIMGTVFDFMKDLVFGLQKEFQFLFEKLSFGIQRTVAFVSALRAGIGVLEAWKIAGEVATQAVNEMSREFQKGFVQNKDTLDSAKIKLQEMTDLINVQKLRFEAGEISAEKYYETITSKEIAALQSAQTRAQMMEQVAALENFTNDKSLIDFMRMNEQKRQSLEDLKRVQLLTNKQIVENSLDTFGRLESALSAAGEANKAFARASQAVAIGMAIVNTALAISKARSAAPPPFNYILAGIEAAAGAIQIATIASQKFAVGTPNVPQDMFAQVHKGETIVPATFAEAIRKGDLSLSGGGNKGGGGDINIVINYPKFNNKEDMDKIMYEMGLRIEQQLRYARGT
jgi:hypothetical protein